MQIAASKKPFKQQQGYQCTRKNRDARVHSRVQGRTVICKHIPANIERVTKGNANIANILRSLKPSVLAEMRTKLDGN